MRAFLPAAARQDPTAGPTLRPMDGTDLAHDDVGTGPDLVFLHGITCDRSNWTPVVERLAAGGLDRPVVVGHSYGAFIATLVGTTAPVRGVVNVDQELDTAAFARRLAPLEPRLRGEDFDAAFQEFVVSLRPDLVPEERRASIVMRPDRDVVLGVWTTVFDTPPADLVAMVEPVLAGYPVPYLAIYGAPVSVEERRLLGLIPDVEVEEWDGLGHFVQLADPDRTAERIRRFAAAR